MHDHFKEYLSPYLSTIFILENANDFIFHSLPTNLLPHVKYVVSGFKMFDVHDELHQDNTSEKSWVADAEWAWIFASSRVIIVGDGELPRLNGYHYIYNSMTSNI